MWLYIDEYEFEGVQSLCEAIGHPITPLANDAEALKQELARGEWGSATHPTVPKNPPTELEANEG